MDITYKPETPMRLGPCSLGPCLLAPLWMLTALLMAHHPQRPSHLVTVCEPSMHGRVRLFLQLLRLVFA